MKKMFKVLNLILFLSINILTLTGCSNKKEQFLEITNEDIYDKPGKTGKIDDIVLMFIFAKPKKTACSVESFDPWDWNLENRKKIIGTSDCGDLDTKRERWEIILQKTKDKGVYVSDWKKEIAE